MPEATDPYRGLRVGADRIHWLTGGPDLAQCRIACGAREAVYALRQREAVTCERCLAPAQTRAHASSSTGVTEKQWLQHVRTLAHTQGWRTYHPLRSQGSEAGWVDLVCLRPPVLVLAELKTDHGRLTAAQRQWLEGLQQVTTIATHLWRPEHWDQVVQVLAGSHAPSI